MSEMNMMNEMAATLENTANMANAGEALVDSIYNKPLFTREQVITTLKWTGVAVLTGTGVYFAGKHFGWWGKKEEPAAVPEKSNEGDKHFTPEVMKEHEKENNKK